MLGVDDSCPFSRDEEREREDEEKELRRQQRRAEELKRELEKADRPVKQVKRRTEWVWEVEFIKVTNQKHFIWGPYF